MCACVCVCLCVIVCACVRVFACVSLSTRRGQASCSSSSNVSKIPDVCSSAYACVCMSADLCFWHVCACVCVCVCVWLRKRSVCSVWMLSARHAYITLLRLCLTGAAVSPAQGDACKPDQAAVLSLYCSLLVLYTSRSYNCASQVLLSLQPREMHASLTRPLCSAVLSPCSFRIHHAPTIVPHRCCCVSSPRRCMQA